MPDQKFEKIQHFPYFEPRWGCWVADWAVCKEEDSLVFTCLSEEGFELPYAFREDRTKLAFSEFANTVTLEQEHLGPSFIRDYGILSFEELSLFTNMGFTDVDLMRPYAPDKDAAIDEEAVLEFAEKFGPLFHYLADGKNSTTITESYSAWRQAAMVMQVAISCVKLLKSDCVDASIMDGQLIFKQFQKGLESLIEVSLVFPGPFVNEYADMLLIQPEEHKKLFPYVYTEGSWRRVFWANKTVKGVFRSDDEPPRLVVQLLNSRDAQFGIDDFDCVIAPSVYLNGEFAPNRQNVLMPLLETLCSLHTRRVSVGWLNEEFILGYPCLLEKLWYDLAVSITNKTIGICPRCGKVFQGRPNKKYCSSGSRGCQGKAKSHRQYWGKE